MEIPKIKVYDVVTSFRWHIIYEQNVTSIWINNQVTLLWVIVSLHCFHFSFVEWLYVMTIWLYDYTTIWNDYMTIMSVRLCHRDVFLFWHTSKKLCIMFSGMQTFICLPYICMLHDFMWGSDCNIRTFELFRHQMHVVWFYSNLYNNVMLGMDLSPLVVLLTRKIVDTSVYEICL